MSDIDNTIDTLREQVEALQADNEQLKEANQEWHEFVNEYDLDTLRAFLENHDIDAVSDLFNEYDIGEIQDGMEFVNSHDIDELQNALRWADVSDLVSAYNKVDEYGDPEELAEKIEDLEEELQHAQNETAEVLVADDTSTSEENVRRFAEQTSLIHSLQAQLTDRDTYIVALKTDIANLEAAREADYAKVPYKALYDSLSNDYYRLLALIGEALREFPRFAEEFGEHV